MKKYALVAVAILVLVAARIITGDNTFCAAIVVLAHNLIRELI